jgi:hypothetical protein
VFSLLMRPNKASPVKVNLDAKCRDYKGKAGQCPDMDLNDGWLVVRNSEVMCGRMDKTTVGSGKKDSIFYIILRDFGPDEAVSAMNQACQDLSSVSHQPRVFYWHQRCVPVAKAQGQETCLVTIAYRRM